MITLNLFLAEMGSVEKTAITVLAVAGGFGIGFFLMKFPVNFFSRTASTSKLGKGTRAGGGAAAAIAVYMMLNGDGGLGLGGRGGGESRSANEGKNTETPAQVEPQVDQPKTKAAPRTGAMRVYVLAADSPDGLFFRVDEDPQPLTIQQVLDKIELKDRSEATRLRYIEIRKGAEFFSDQQAQILYSELLRVWKPKGITVASINAAVVD